MALDKFVTPEINLLPKEDMDSKPGGELLKWALSWGKKIVIVTELIVVLAFLSRFKIDADVANLSDEIDRKKELVVASSDFERVFRSLTDRLGQVEKLDSQTSVLKVYDQILELIPPGVNVGQITIDKGKISFNGKGSDADLEQMVSAFKNTNYFQAVTINRVSKDQSSVAADFSLSANYR